VTAGLVGAAASAGRLLLDLLLPAVCVACERLRDGADGGAVCGRCWARLRHLPRPQCPRCGHPVADARRCRWCDQLPPWVRAARSVCWYPGGSARSIVHALKYAGWRDVAAAIGERMARLDWPDDVVAERAAVVAVPLARARERERGFNQSALIARAVAARWAVPDWSDVLCRTRSTATQTRLTPEARRRNVSRAFRTAAGAASRLRGSHLVLVDDVMTTGATAVECATELFENGARIVSVVTFGRAPALGDRPPDRSDS